VQACMGWSRQMSAPEAWRAPPSPPPKILTLSDAGALAPPGLTLPRPRARSDGGAPWATGEGPAYVPLPTIPSASKIFAACHTGLDDLQDDGLDDAGLDDVVEDAAMLEAQKP